VFVVSGDGELDEGSMWEATLVAAAKRLDNLVLIVDRNKFQANFPTEELIPLEPIEKKFEAFGWSVRRIDGHDFDQMERAFSAHPIAAGKPAAIIADTVRGKGLPSIERRADRWFVNFTGEEIEMLLRELHGSSAARLTSDPIMNR
jgi:transketolase